MHTPVLLYDGDCGVCARSVQFVLRHESVHPAPLNFATLSGAFAAALHESFPHLAHVDSVLWYEPAAAGRAPRVLVRSDAALRVLEHVGGMWRVLAWLGGLTPRPVRDALYDAVARRRKQISASACIVPSPTSAPRFLP